MPCTTRTSRAGPTGAASRSPSTAEQGWLIETDITVVDPDLDFPGDRAIFIVVADGSDWGMFFGAVPIGDALLEEVMARTVRDLQAR